MRNIWKGLDWHLEHSAGTSFNRGINGQTALFRTKKVLPPRQFFPVMMFFGNLDGKCVRCGDPSPEDEKIWLCVPEPYTHIVYDGSMCRRCDKFLRKVNNFPRKEWKKQKKAPKQEALF